MSADNFIPLTVLLHNVGADCDKEFDDNDTRRATAMNGIVTRYSYKVRRDGRLALRQRSRVVH